MSNLNTPTSKPKPWEVMHDLPMRQSADYLGVCLTKMYEIANSGDVETYYVPGPGTRKARRCVRESLERLRAKLRKNPDTQDDQQQQQSAA